MANKVTFSVKGLILQNNKFLIVKRNNSNPEMWELPGGHLEYGETAEDAVIREIKEETGLLVKPISLIDTWNLYIPNRQITGVIYKCSAKDFQIKLSDEHCDYKWITNNDDDFEIIHPAYRDKMKNWDWNKIV